MFYQWRQQDRRRGAGPTAARSARNDKQPTATKLVGRDVSARRCEPEKKRRANSRCPAKARRATRISQQCYLNNIYHIKGLRKAFGVKKNACGYLRAVVAASGGPSVFQARGSPDIMV
jgi:hypothetical protein